MRRIVWRSQPPVSNASRIGEALHGPEDCPLRSRSRLCGFPRSLCFCRLVRFGPGSRHRRKPWPRGRNLSHDLAAAGQGNPKGSVWFSTAETGVPATPQLACKCHVIFLVGMMPAPCRAPVVRLDRTSIRGLTLEAGTWRPRPRSRETCSSRRSGGTETHENALISSPPACGQLRAPRRATP